MQARGGFSVCTHLHAIFLKLPIVPLLKDSLKVTVIFVKVNNTLKGVNCFKSTVLKALDPLGCFSIKIAIIITYMSGAFLCVQVAFLVGKRPTHMEVHHGGVGGDVATGGFRPAIAPPVAPLSCYIHFVTTHLRLNCGEETQAEGAASLFGRSGGLLETLNVVYSHVEMHFSIWHQHVRLQSSILGFRWIKITLKGAKRW